MSQQRLREILTVFGRLGLTGVKERKQPFDQQQLPVKLRLAFEQLGPSFVKMGQILSTRSDLLPAVYIDELKKLQDQVQPMSSDQAMQAIETELGGPFSEVFADLSEQPLAAASVAQTHRAQLLDGREVIVKIQRPHLQTQTKEDLRLLIKLSKRLPAGFLPMVDVPKVLSQLEASLLAEIDFRHEAHHLTAFAAQNADLKCLGIPEVVTAYTTPRMLVETYIPGYRINDYPALLAAGYDLEDIGQKLMLCFIKQVFKDGYFHGDPHPGNLLIHEGKIYFIDFGIVSKLEEGLRISLNEVLYSFTSQDVDGMTRAVLSMSSSDIQVNTTQLGRDIERMMTKYGNLSLGVLAITDLVEDLLLIFRKHHLQVPAEITILGKAALQIEGIFRELAPELDLMTLAKQYFIENMGADILHQTLNRDAFLIELLYLLRNGKSIPRRLNQLMEQVLGGRILLNHDLIDFVPRFQRLQRLANRFILALLFASLLLAGSLLSFNPGMQGLSKFCLIGAAFILIWLLFLIIKTERDK